MQPRGIDKGIPPYLYDHTMLQPGGYYQGDCFKLLQKVESGSAGMVLIDPPYYTKKDRDWDSFEGKADYLYFMGRAFIQSQQILRPNGTLGFWHNDLRKIAWQQMPHALFITWTASTAMFGAQGSRRAGKRPIRAKSRPTCWSGSY